MNLLKSLCVANDQILRQKIALMDILSKKHGLKRSKELFQTTCPIAKATIGQHFRHSMDHIEPAVMFALGKWTESIHYDKRVRGREDESDWDAASNRIHSVQHHLQKLGAQNDSHPLDMQLDVFFMLSGDSNDEFALPTTAARELGFAMHHAIHHLAVVRIIAECSHVGNLSENELPGDFGRAPSTVNFDRSN